MEAVWLMLWLLAALGIFIGMFMLLANFPIITISFFTILCIAIYIWGKWEQSQKPKPMPYIPRRRVPIKPTLRHNSNVTHLNHSKRDAVIEYIQKKNADSGFQHYRPKIRRPYIRPKTKFEVGCLKIIKH